MTEAELAAARAKLEAVWEKMTAADFERLHQKFIDMLVALEVGFARRFPDEFAIWEREQYGEFHHVSPRP